MVRFEICGNLGRDPQAYQAGQQQVVRFTVAHTFPSFTTDRGQMVPESTTWLNISAWGALGKAVLNHLHKGDKVFVSGTIRQRETTDQQGNRQYFTDYEAREVEFMQRRQEATTAAPATAPATATVQPAATTAPAAAPTTAPAVDPQTDFPFPPPVDDYYGR